MSKNLTNGVRPTQTRWRLAGLVWAVVVLCLTLWPAPQAGLAASATPTLCLVCGPEGGADFFQNLVLLFPLGFFLARGGLTLTVVVVGGAILALGIEIGQYLLVSGRDAALGDWVANTLGISLGWATAHLLGRPHQPSVAWTTMVLGVFAIQLVATSRLIEPAKEASSPRKATVTPTVTGRPTYPGEFLGITLGTDSNDRDASATAHSDLNPVTARLEWFPSTDRTTSAIFRFEDPADPTAPTVAIDRRGTRIGITTRIVAHQFRLRAATFVRDVNANQGDTIVVTLRRERGTVHIGAGIHDDGITARLGAQHGWTLINPFTPTHALGPIWERWTLAWLFGWGGFLGWSAARRRRAVAWLVAAVIALVVVTALGNTTATLSEVAALIAGWTTAWGISWSVVRRET